MSQNRQPENTIQSDIREFLQWNGWFVIRNHQSLGSHKGLSDLTVIKNGRVVWIEVKTKKGKLSVHQVEFRNAIEAHGGEYILARGIDDVKHLIKGAVIC